MALGTEIVDFIGFEVQDQVAKGLSIGQISVMEQQAGILVDVFVEVVDTSGAKARAASDESMHEVTFLKQKLGQVGAILSGDPGNQC